MQVFSNDDLIGDMLLLGEITMNDEGLILFADFCRLFRLINKHLQPRLIRRRNQGRIDRRHALQDLNMQNYRHLVNQMNMVEAEVNHEIMS